MTFSDTPSQSYGDRCEIIIPGDYEKTLTFCVDNFFTLAAEAITERGRFALALSGGSTPKAIYELLTDPRYRNRIDWSKVLLFWSDERAVPPDNPASNYHMAMEAGFINFLPEHIFRMQAEGDIEKEAVNYEELIHKTVLDQRFDLVMLGMGEDGHVASLFPKTHGLHAKGRLVIANYVPALKVWRMTLTFACINAAHHTIVYIFGTNKAAMVKKVLTAPYNPDELPIQAVGSPSHKAVWILDTAAASALC